MKTLLALATLALCALGCSNMQTREQRCGVYAETYSLYLTTTAVRPVSKEESGAALVAAIFLRTYCGWTGPDGAGQKSGPTADVNGVPILLPPAAPPGARSFRAQSARNKRPANNDPEGLHVLLQDGSTIRIPVIAGTDGQSTPPPR